MPLAQPKRDRLPAYNTVQSAYHPNQSSSAIAFAWITATFGIKTIAVRDLGLRDAEDREIFEAAKAQGVVVMTKDRDFALFS